MNIPPGYAQINVIHSGIAMPRGAQITYGLSNAGPTLTAQALADQQRELWRTHLRPLMPTTTRCDRIRVKLGPNSTGEEATAEVGDDGDRSNTPDSPQVAALVTKKAATGGRVNRGRWFLPYVIETDTNSGGLLASGAQVFFQDHVDDWLAANVALGKFPVILHNSIELAPTIITQLVVQTQVATQRRRLRRVGGRKRIL